MPLLAHRKVGPEASAPGVFGILLRGALGKRLALAVPSSSDEEPLASADRAGACADTAARLAAVAGDMPVRGDTSQVGACAPRVGSRLKPGGVGSCPSGVAYSVPGTALGSGGVGASP